MSYVARWDTHTGTHGHTYVHTYTHTDTDFWRTHPTRWEYQAGKFGACTFSVFKHCHPLRAISGG